MNRFVSLKNSSVGWRVWICGCALLLAVACGSEEPGDDPDVGTDAGVPDADQAVGNACGGEEALILDGEATEPGDRCGPCGDGIAVCDGIDQVRCVQATELNECGGCEPLHAEEGDACGPCEDGAYQCGADSRLECVGAKEQNACGGCAELSETPNTSCDAAGGETGVVGCTGPDDVRCVLAGENACGGSLDLDQEPGTFCGPCAGGVVACTDADETTCSNEDRGLNDCGGCRQLPGMVDHHCGGCNGRLACDGEDSLICEGGTGNACGGCEELEAFPGQQCNGASVYVCHSPDSLTCPEDETNACGGMGELDGTPLAPCGPCDDGALICAAPDVLTCSGAASTNACGGCAVLAGDPGTDCPGGQTWQCDGLNQVICEDDLTQLAIDLDEYPGMDTDDRIVIDPTNFELSYHFQCEPSGCQSNCRFDGGAWFDCDSPYRAGPEDEHLQIQEGYLNFEVRASHEGDHSSPADVETLVLFDFDVELDNAEPYDPEAEEPESNFPGSYTASCSRPDCEIECFWEGDGINPTETDCALEESFVVELPAEDLDKAYLVVEACAQNLDLNADDEHCTEPKTYRFDPPPPAFIGVDTGARHTCGLVEDQSIWCWGHNDAGQVGVDSDDSTIPVATKILNRDWEVLSAGAQHSCAINDSDELYCWGDNSAGQLGFTPANHKQPGQVDQGSWRRVSAGEAHTCAIDTDDELWCWGSNTFAQLGNADAESGQQMWNVGLPDESSDGWIDVSAGNQHSCAIAHRSSGGRAAYCWGTQDSGRLGNGEVSGFANTPQDVMGDLFNWDVDTISSGHEHTCAAASLGSNKRAYCWGAGSMGRLGNGTDGNWTIPELVENSYDYLSISAGWEHSCALHDDGEVYCWGANLYHQLGTGGGDQTHVPEPIDVGDATTFVSISTGDEHSCALDTTGFVYCWGREIHGQLGVGQSNGNYLTADVPTRIAWPQGEFIP